MNKRARDLRDFAGISYTAALAFVRMQVQPKDPAPKCLVAEFSRITGTKLAGQASACGCEECCAWRPF